MPEFPLYPYFLGSCVGRTLFPIWVVPQLTTSDYFKFTLIFCFRHIKCMWYVSIYLH